MFRSFFRRRADPYPRVLYARIVEQARSPDLYLILGVPDTLDGRFDMLVLHLSAVIDRLRREDRAVDEHGQHLFDLFVTDMDHNLREMAVGDLSVPKKMKKIGQAFYGRFGAYTRAEDADALARAIGRNVFPGDGPDVVRPAAEALARYYIELRRGLASRTADQLLAGDVAFPAVPGLSGGAGPRGSFDDDPLSGATDPADR